MLWPRRTSSLAASLADEGGLTLVGFLRGTTMNVYAGAHRVISQDAAVHAAVADPVAADLAGEGAPTAG